MSESGSNVDTLIETIKQMVRSAASIDSFADPLHRLVSAAPNSIGSRYEPGVELFRATKHHQSIPERIEELWFPPADKAAEGRANRAGSPLFYCSSDPNCAFREIGAAVGQCVVHAKWSTSAAMLLHDLGYSVQVLDRAGSRRALSAQHASFYETRLDDLGKKVRDFLALAFTDPTPASYAFTTAIAEFHLRGDDFHGLLYPAVSKAANVDNLALRPDFVRSGLSLVSAQLVKVDRVDGDGSVAGVILADLVSVERDGTLHWSFRAGGITVAPGSGVDIEAGSSFTVAGLGQIQIDGRQYQVAPGFLIETSKSGDVMVRDLSGQIVAPLPE